MKLDKIRFARLISFITSQVGSMTSDVIEDLDDMIEVEMPQPTPFRPDAADVNRLIGLIHEGGEFKYRLEAIKLHRNITGSGLKEAKEFIEAHWKYPAKLPDADEIRDHDGSCC